jgi:hypothetical protein
MTEILFARLDEVAGLIAAAVADRQPLDATLTALAALDGTAGLLVVTGADTFARRTLAAPVAGITITNPAGTAGNPTFALANDLSALEGLGSTGFAVRSAADTWIQRSIAGTANEITLSNGDGVAGNPTVSLPAALTFTGKTVTGGAFENVTIGSTTANVGSFTTVTSPVYKSATTVTFQSNGTTFAGRIGTDQRWYIGGSDVAPPTSSTTPLTISKNTAVIPRFQTQNPVLILAEADNAQTWAVMQSFSNTSGHGTGLGMARAGGTASTPTSVQNTQQVGFNFMYSYCASGDCASPGYKAVAGFEAIATDNMTDTTQGTRLAIYAAPTGGTLAVRMSVTAGVGIGTTAQIGAGLLYTSASTFMIGSKTSYANGAGAGVGTITNAPAAGNPTKWIPVDDNGTTRYVPAW